MNRILPFLLLHARSLWVAALVLFAVPIRSRFLNAGDGVTTSMHALQGMHAEPFIHILAAEGSLMNRLQ